VRFRPAPDNPGPKDRKVDSYELVVKAPAGAGQESVGGKDRKPYGLVAKEPDAARLEAIVFLARKAGRRIRASSWPIERIESLLCFDVIEKYAAVKYAEPANAKNKKEDRNKRKMRLTYLAAVRSFQCAFPELEIGDIKGESIHGEYERRTGRPATSRFVDLKTVKRALNGGLVMLGTSYVVRFVNPNPGRLDKSAWTVEEYDRLLRAADNWLFEPGGAPKMIPGPVQARRNCFARGAWLRGIAFLPYTASRHGRLPPTRWVPPEVEPSDGLPLPRNDRPWIEVTNETIYYHRDGDVPHDGNKRRDGNVIPAEFAPAVRAWYEADMAAGREFVFHQHGGQRYRGLHLCHRMFRQIVKDAGLQHKRIPHHLKDLAVEWAEAARMRLETLAAHAATRPETLAGTYGDAKRTALLEEAADEMTQGGWREKARRRAAIVERFARSRAGATKAPRPKRQGAAQRD
jgi:hypothetical protein